MLLEKLKDNKRFCTGCGACESICPVDAIRMLPDEEGFFVPVIDDNICISCKLCEKVCPQLGVEQKNNPEPRCYAVRAGDDVVKRSASGGAFTILAEFVFENRGYVCGAAYDDDFRGVSLIMISSPDDMYKLRGSKYVYAKHGNIYKEVEDKLSNDEWVLFSGTPCQVAGLNNYLKKNYNKLLTVDILCGGVPSEKIFRLYIEEIANGRKPSSVNFRPKEYGWHYSGIKTEFEDGTVHIVHSVRDPYLRGFMNWLYVGNACADCSFATTPRQGDFTIGDFWNIDKYDDELEYDDGVSCLLLNSKKSEDILEKIINKFSLIRNIPLSFLRRYNRLQTFRAHSLARSRFFSLIDRGFSFEKATKESLGWKFDIALTGCWTVNNYGGSITYYAFYNVLKDMGYTVLMTEKRMNIPGYDIPVPTLFKHNPYPFYDVSRILKSFEEQKELNNRIRTFILGSDQIWNYRFMGNDDSVNSYSLDYVSDYRKRISYGSSFGSDSFLGSEEQKKEFSGLIKKFNSVSVREPSAVDLLKTEFGVDSQRVLDPVFLCDIRHYYDLIDKANICAEGDYLFTYFIHPREEKKGFELIAKELDCGLRNTINADKIILDIGGFSHETWEYTYENNLKAENWLYLIMNSKYVITDSFHAICLSIIFRKNFAFVKGNMTNDKGLERITSLLELLNIKDRFFFRVKDIEDNNCLKEELDYDSIHRILDIEKNRSLEWLKNAIEN